jgi:hypothetical protein
MKRRYALTGLGAVAALALVTTAIAGGGLGSGDGPSGKAAAKKKAKPGPPGPAGPQGAQGPQGPQGPAGANGTNGTNGTNGATNVTTRSTPLTVNAQTQNSATAQCNPGERATGGGWSQAMGDAANTLILRNGEPTPNTVPGTPTGWTVQLFNNDATDPQTYTVWVICAAP